jgi:hypothetical protein
MRRAKQDRLAPARHAGYNVGMSWTRRFLWAFWIFIGVMLCWQLYSCNDKIATAAAQPKQEHFFFYQPTKQTIAAAAHESAFVEQSAFTVEDNVPNDASFTCHVTLKNSGKTKAINVQVCVRPYRGGISGTDDAGPNVSAPISDDNPLAQINQWVSFPDIDAGATSTQTVVFMKEHGASNYGNNPKAEIVFQTEKKK